MPFDYVDIKTGSPVSVSEAEKTKIEADALKRRLNELDAVVLDILLDRMKEGL